MSPERPTSGDDIRDAYLRFFEERGHLIMPSASLIPAKDPTLLLTPAGMAPFKPYYAGDETPPNKRLTSAQKCFRTTDIDLVGDRTHHTMFEMLGNFSIGDYFKREAIAWAWEFLTSVMDFPAERLWVTVHHTDDEAYAMWRDDIGVPESRMTRCGDKDNFWGPAGDEGACGPSSEIHYDLHPDAGDVTPCDDPVGRFVEIWNLVFPQFIQAKDGTRTDMPTPGIDTGLGLERVTAIVQGVPSAYETDLLKPVVQRVEQISGLTYGVDEEKDFAVRVVTEHTRSATFLIADGVVPANEGRGYVLRKVIRRGIRFARKLGIDQPFMTRVAEAVVDRMGERYPELVEHRRFVLRSLESEEERFAEAIALGMPLLEGMVAAGQPVSGKDAFLLYDTYGFPLELTQEVAREQGLDVDVEGFEREMDAQRKRGRSAARFSAGRDLDRLYGTLNTTATEFLGYESLEADATIAGMLKDGELAQTASVGDEVEIVLDRTPFYAEGGGQVGDAGAMTGSAGAEASITDTQRPVGDLISHRVTIVNGTLSVGEAVHVAVDAGRRLDIMRNHTATHLLHAVLRDVLGTHVRQAGSLVAPDRLRFDFTHVAAVDPEELTRIERTVNDEVRGDLALVKREESHREAVARGALAFFGERYGETVRTIQIGEDSPVSFELCGGTHLDRTGQIGTFRVIAEGSVGTGVRRIEAVTGRGADVWVAQRLAMLDEVAAKLHVAPAEAAQRVDALLAQAEEARKTASAGQREASRDEAEGLLEKAHEVNGVTVLAARSSANDSETLRETGDWLRDKLGSAIVVLGAVVSGKDGDRPTVLTMVTQDLVARGYSAGDIVKAAAGPIGGRGGGRPQLAQAGGKDASKLDEALETAVTVVREQGS